MNKCIKIYALTCLLVQMGFQTMAQQTQFPWPDGKKMAISLSFDDARLSNVGAGTDLLDEYDVKATFFIVPSNAEKALAGWKKAVSNGHEMGNHSSNHACSGNFVWSRANALENYSVEKMRQELIDANKRIHELLGVTPTVYAYPCGQTFIGRGKNTQSFVPVISDLFVAGRGWRNEAPVDPAYCDMAQLTGMEMDGKNFDEILEYINDAKKGAQWLVLAGHETAESGSQTSRLSMLRALCAYAKDPANGIWIAPIGEVAAYVNSVRDTINLPEMISMNNQNQLVLVANKGKGICPKIQFMPEWKAFGWFTGADYIEWDIEITKAGIYQAELEWSVSNEEAGKNFVIESPVSILKGKVGKSGSWETFKTQSIGQLRLHAGKQKIRFKPAEPFEKGALLDLRKLVLQAAK
jgi:peptidoglycan/xylan/chitin deacetylase (PgdA/CDA1 family)